MCVHDTHIVCLIHIYPLIIAVLQCTQGTCLNLLAHTPTPTRVACVRWVRSCFCASCIRGGVVVGAGECSAGRGAVALGPTCVESQRHFGCRRNSRALARGQAPATAPMLSVVAFSGAGTKVRAMVMCLMWCSDYPLISAQIYTRDVDEGEKIGVFRNLLLISLGASADEFDEYTLHMWYQRNRYAPCTLAA